MEMKIKEMETDDSSVVKRRLTVERRFNQEDKNND